MTRRKESPEQRRKRVKRDRAEMTLRAWDRSVLENRLYEWRRKPKRDGGEYLKIIFSHTDNDGPIAQRDGGLPAHIPSYSTLRAPTPSGLWQMAPVGERLAVPIRVRGSK